VARRRLLRSYVFFPPEHLPSGVFLEVNHDVANEVRWQDDKEY
jgi:hypothetical protein